MAKKKEELILKELPYSNSKNHSAALILLELRELVYVKYINNFLTFKQASKEVEKIDKLYIEKFV